MNGNENDKEKFANLRDQIFQKGYSSELGLKCQICKKNDHSERRCNLLNYAPNKPTLIAKHNHSEV